MQQLKDNSPAQQYLQVAVLVETSLAAGRDILSGIAEYVRRHDQWIIYTYEHDIDRPPPHWFGSWRCDGIIVRMHDRGIAKVIEDRHVPIVDVLGIYDRGKYPLVHTDNKAIGRLAADHFRERGFASYGFVGLDDEYWSLERCDSFAARVEEFGYPCKRLLWSNEQEKKHTLRGRLRWIGQWLRKLTLPAAIFVCNDSRAMALRDAALNVGLVVGRDIAILGVGNDQVFCNMPSPSLSSIDAGHRQVGYDAAAVLDAMMKGEPFPTEPKLIPPVGVVVRESSDFLAVPDQTLQEALHYIRTHAKDGIGVDDVADACNTSRSVIQRRFRSHLGQTIHDFILMEKTRRAISLLRSTTDSIEAIARASGFEYVQSLNKVLRRLYGRSAKEYRREIPHRTSA